MYLKRSWRSWRCQFWPRGSSDHQLPKNDFTMKKNGFQFYLLVIISPGLGKQPSKYFIISSSSFSVSLPSLGKSPMSPCAIHQICPQPEEWKRFPLPRIFHCIFPLWYWRYVGLRFLPHWRLVQQVVVEGQHLGPEGEQDISRAVIAAREKPRRLFPRTQGLLRCSCKENEMVDEK